MEHPLFPASKYLQSEDDISVLKDVVKEHLFSHEHEFIEIVYVASGKGTHIVKDKKDFISEGNIILLNAHVAHEYYAEPGMPLELRNCICQPLSVDSSFKDCKDFLDVAYHYLFRSFYSDDDPKDYIILMEETPKEIGAIFENMYVEYGKKENGYKQILKSELIKLLIMVFRLYRKSTEKKQNIPFYKKLIVENTYQYIKEHYAENIKYEQLAERSYLSLSCFSKIFKEVTGVTVTAVLQNYRIEASCDLLKNTRLPITEIASAVGYTDAKHYYKLFRQIKSVTPGEYRKKNRITL